jgi:hypothetical protein
MVVHIKIGLANEARENYEQASAAMAALPAEVDEQMLAADETVIVSSPLLSKT